MTNKVKVSFAISLILMLYIIVVTILNTGTTLYNPSADKTATILNEVEPYGTDYVYNEKIPSTADPVVLVEGINGLNYTYDGLNYTHLNDMANQILEVGTGASGDYKGRLTGYGPDCPGCSVVGNVACRTKSGKNHSLIHDGLYYLDDVYGNVRILAADNSAFPCGTIVKVDNGNLKEFYGIVLDSGSTMRKAWSNGTVWIDMAFDSQKTALTAGATSSNTSFSVQRWGW